METTARQRVKLDHLKRRLAQLEAERDARSDEAQSLYMILTLERHKLKLDEALAWPRATFAARARLRAQARGSDLDVARIERAIAEPWAGGRLAGPLQPLRPPLVSADAARWNPLRLAIVGRSQTAFYQISDPRLAARTLGDPLVEAPDVLVFPHAESKSYHADAKLVSDPQWERVRKGLTTVVFDASSEGYPHSPEDALELHAFLRSHGADPSNALYLTQDRRYGADYAAWCASQSTQPMRTWVFDTFVFRVLSDFRYSGSKVFERRLADFLGRPAQRSRRFVSLNYTPRPTKVLFLLRLLRDDLWDQGWISFGGFAAEGDGDGFTRAAFTKRLLAADGFRDEVDALFPLMDQLAAMDPVLFLAEQEFTKDKLRTHTLGATNLEPYRNSWFSVVTETEMKPHLHRITEKPLKPLLAFHPFLVLGNPGSLELLRGYGFETFSGVYDERYDEEPDPRRRFDMVYDQVRRLCAQDEAEMARMDAQLSEIVTFNACWGLTELPRRFNDQVVADLVDQLAPNALASRPIPSAVS